MPPPFEGLAVLRSRNAKVAEVLRFADGSTKAVGVPLPVSLDGRRPHRAALARSAGGRYLIAHWRVEPEGRKRIQYGAITATRLCLIDAARVAP
jgi:hypothetical protein